MRSFFLVASAVAGTVTVYAVVEEPTIRLEQVQILDIGADVAALAVHPNRALLYASIRSAPSVAVLSIDPRTGVLARIGEVPVSSQLVSLACDRDGRHLFGASYRDDVVVSLALDGNNLPTQEVDSLAAGSHPHCVVPSPDGSVWVSALGDDIVLRIPVNEHGRFVRADIHTTTLPTGFGPRHLVVATRRHEVLVIGERSGDIARIAAEDGTLVGRWSTLPAGAELAPGIVRELDRENPASAPDGRPLTWAADLALGADEDVVYSCERSTSLLSISSVRDGGLRRAVGTETQPRAIALDPAGRYLLATGQLSATVTMYAVDPHDGDIEAVAQAPVPAGALWVESLRLPAG